MDLSNWLALLIGIPSAIVSTLAIIEVVKTRGKQRRRIDVDKKD